MEDTNSTSTNIIDEELETSRYALTAGLLAEIIGAQLPDEIEPDSPCGRVLTQSIYVKPGEVVISAGWYADDTIITEALEKGASMVFCSHEAKKRYPDPHVIPVDDPMECVLRFERWRARDCNAKRIAITGSVGKTTSVGLINAVVAKSFPTLTHHTMANSHGAVLRNVQNLEPSHEFWVQEVGGAQPGYIESSAKFLEPDAVVLTNIGHSHLDLYRTRENIIKDKTSLERYAKPDGVVIINIDDEVLSNTEYTHRVITCSYDDPKADYYAENVRMELDGLYFDLVCEEGRFPIHLNLYGNFNVYNALFAFAVGRWAGVPAEKIAPLLEEYQPGGMRQNMIHVGGYNLFVDCFNAEPKTVLGAAETLSQIPAKNGGRKIFVTGHINKIGEESPALHEALGHSLAKVDVDQILLFAGDSKYTYKGILDEGGTNAILMETREQLDDWLRRNVTHDDIVSFKSSPSFESMALTVDNVFGTNFENGRQFNEGSVEESDGFRFRLRMDNIAELEGYDGTEKDVVIPDTCGEHIVRRISPRAFSSNSDITSVVIPDSVNNIGHDAFYSCSSLTRVHLPSSLKIVGKNAFNNCRALKELVIPEGTIQLERHAFFDCRDLADVTVPDSIGYIGADAFGTTNVRNEHRIRLHCVPGSYAEQTLTRQNVIRIGCCKLSIDCFNAEPKSVLETAKVLSQIPVMNDGRRILVTGHLDCLGEESASMHEELGRELAGLNLDQILLFGGDSKYIYKGILEEGGTNAILFELRVQLADWLSRNTVHDDVVFFKGSSGCSNLAKTVDDVFGTEFQNGQESNEGTLVEADGFRFRLRMDNIAEVVGYTGTDTEVVIPAACGDHSVRRIAPRAFSRKTGIKSVIIPDTVDNIGFEAFYLCRSLTKIHLPASLKIIAKNAFNSCLTLHKLAIPEGTIHLDRHAFFDCRELTDITVPDSIGYMGADVFGVSNPRNEYRIQFHCTPGSYAEKNVIRQNLIQTNTGRLYIDPSESGPEEVVSTAESLSQIPVTGEGHRILVTGHLGKPKKKASALHKQFGSSLAGVDLDQILLYTEGSKYIYAGVQEAGGSNAILIETQEQLENWLDKNVSGDDIVFFKGSLGYAALAETISNVFGTIIVNEKLFDEVIEEDKGFMSRMRKSFG